MKPLLIYQGLNQGLTRVGVAQSRRPGPGSVRVWVWSAATLGKEGLGYSPKGESFIVKTLILLSIAGCCSNGLSLQVKILGTPAGILATR